MTALLRTLWQALRREAAPQSRPAAGAPLVHREVAPPLDIASDDPLIAYLLRAGGAVEVDTIELDSPGVRMLRAAGVKLAVPLVSQGELIGLLNLGPRLSEQEYSADDRALLNNLATQAAPALRVAQLVRQQQAEAQDRERHEHELRVARLIQQTLLPRTMPSIPGWRLASHYQPARAVGGDFYDFVELNDGRLVIFVGDVTDKGVPAALLMATTRSILRAAAQRLVAPGTVLRRANEHLYGDIPPNMFVTCLCAVLDPESGRLWYANAGHHPPYLRRAGQAEELRAVGMPLGLMPDMQYHEHEIMLEPGDGILLYSDGIVEAHSPARELFGFPRLQAAVTRHTEARGHDLIAALLEDLASFAGAGWEQEDDITLVTIECDPVPGRAPRPLAPEEADRRLDGPWARLAEHHVPSQPGNEHLALRYLAEAVRDLGLAPRQLERLRTAVAEATMNAMEHGNSYRPDAPVLLEVLASQAAIVVRITDHGGGRDIPAPEVPDLEAKLAGLQPPRGWGLFLIERLVDRLRVNSEGERRTLELILYREEDRHAGKAS
ncbi:MAG TPA: SpoIIE family protein phosphatase [Roseiflexaceae bacterium]|nr:SpoIIE family protein phosphatase [Roseiflexaceae bacterium]